MRIMTYNIWGDYFGNPCALRSSDIEETVRKYLPDVIGVQEITGGWYDDGIFGRLSDKYTLVEGWKGNYTPLLFNKDAFDIKECGWELMEKTPDPSKSITWAVLCHKDTKELLAVLCTHFWWMKRNDEDDEIRLANSEQLYMRMEALRERYGCKVFAFGDFNSHYNSNVMDYFRERGILSSVDIAEKYSGTSSNHGDPQKGEDGKYHGTKTENSHIYSLDHIITYKDTKITSQAIVEDREALDSSDHSPVYIDF